MADKSLSTIAQELYQGFGRNPANRELAKTLTFRAPIVEEFNPTYFIPRGIDALRNADYGALKGLVMRDYMKSATPREDIGRGMTAAGDVLMGGMDVSPLAALKGPVKAGVKYAGRELGPVANRRMEQAMDDLGLRLNVVKPEGGQWADSTRNLIEKTFNERGEARYMPEVTNWLNTAGKKYVLNRMGSPSDELRLLLDKEMSHLDPRKLRDMATELSQHEKDLIRAKRSSQGFPAEGMAESQAAKRFELMTDEFISPNPASVYQTRFKGDAPWAEKLDPDTPIYSKDRGVSYLFDEAGFPEMSQALERAVKSGDIRAEQLNKVSVADAAKLAHDYRVADEAAALSELPKLREYPEGYSWQELTNEDPATLDAILKREGDIMQNCIGGYCSDVLEDGTRLFSLRDPAGNPHVNIEVTPGQRREVEMFLKGHLPEEEIAAMSDSELMKVFKGNYPELGERLKPDSLMPRIKQIKGKQNEAPIEDYLPYVQDFVLNPVTSNPYSRVNDLENTGLIDLARLKEHGLFDLSTPGARGRDINAELNRIYPAQRDQFGTVLSGEHGVRIPTFDMMRGIVQEMPGNYATPSSLIDYLKGVEPRPVEQGYSKYWKDVDPPEGFAEGGIVDLDHPNPDEAYEFVEGFAKGGKISVKPHENEYVTKMARYGRKGQYQIANMLGMKPEVEFATVIPEKYFPANEQHNARGDAMRHMLLQAQLMQKYGETPAKIFGWMHENLSGPQGDAEKAMDEYNDQLGREIGRVATDKADMAYRALQAIEQQKAKTMTKEQMGQGYAEGGLVYNDSDVDYDAMYEFK
jgi:hypothetical protein